MLGKGIEPLKGFIKRMGVHLIGHQDGFSLEHRVFNGICLLTILIVAYNVPFSFIAGLPVTGIVFAVLLFVLAGVYYMVRFRKQLQAGVAIVSLLVLILFSVNYFFSGGIAGASLLSFTLAFFLVIIIAPVKQYWTWIMLFLATVGALLVIEYVYPQSVIKTYQDKQSQFLDLASTFIINIVVISSGLLFVKQAYYREKRLVEEKTRDLERLNNEKTRLFSIISHDLRAPLGSIQAYMEMLGQYEFSREQREVIEQELTNSVRGTQEMLSNLLSWSGSQLKDTRPQLSSNGVQEVLEPVLQIQRILASQKEITMVEDLDPALTAYADIHMLQLIVRNIIGNAIKFTPAYGSIHVRAAVAEGGCLITIQDNGNGIPEERRDDLFSLKAESTYGTANEKGMGLGLYLCREYTLIQHGRIWFESETGVGTTFFMVFPLGDPVIRSADVYV